MSFMRSWSHISQSANMVSEKFEILVKFLFSFSIIVLDMMKLLAILFIIK